VKFCLKYGVVHPAWVAGGLTEALAAAKRECRLLLVYLHSFEHGDSEMFARTLASEAVVQFVDRNMVMWAADAASQAGFETAGWKKLSFLVLLV
jgi:FAS-associated factor 2